MLYFILYEKKKLIAWFINDMLRNSRFYTYGNSQDSYRPTSIPMQCSSTDIFSDQESVESEAFLHEGNNKDIGHNLISFNDIIIEEFKNVNYYQFFYKDERVTCTLIISAIEDIKVITPALVIGTNYGRIFIVSLFQRSEGLANPIIVMDSHFGNQINGLFFANNKYLFSISEEGTLCVTKITSGMLETHFEALSKYKSKVTSIQKRRFDKLFRNIQKDYKHRRRASFTSYTKNLWEFVKIHHTKRFKDMSPFGVNKILEVKDIESLRGQSRNEDTKVDITKLRLRKLREYAFVGEDNVVFLFSLKTMEIQKLLSADSHAIGVYYDSVFDYYFVLTKELNMLFYSRNTLTLERRGDFQDASQILCLDDLIQSIFTKGEVFQSKDMTEISMNDYDTFDKICERKNLYMEFGKHKTLDYLNISLNLPLDYNELSIYSTKYTKALHDFLRIKPNLRDVQENENKRKEMLKTLNGILYLNNHLYNSDANESDFKKSGVNFIKAHIGTKSMLGNNQQIMMVNLKMVIKNIRKKFMNEVDETLEGLSSEEDSDDDYDGTEEQKLNKRSSSIGEDSSRAQGFRRTLSRMAEGDDFEDYKQTQKISDNSSSKRINKPKVMKVRGSSNASHNDKEFFHNNQ